MSKRIWILAFLATLGVLTSAWLSGAAKAGPATVCGDGNLENPPETCDDGNTVSGDGCSANCLIELCGDGILTPDTEQCDNDGANNDDPAVNGCSTTCTCNAETCGDGVLGCTEECDDGNTVDGDACNSDCTLPGVVDPLTKDEQKCVNNANKGAATVVKAENKEGSSCLKDASKGKVADYNACLTADSKGKVNKAKEKANKLRAKGCTGQMPAFGYVVDLAAVNQAMIDASAALSQDVLGDPAAPADGKADKAGAKCQAAFQKDIGKGFDTIWKEILKAKKSAIKGGKKGVPPPVIGNTELAAAIGSALGSSSKVPKALSKVVTDAGKKCTGDVSALFPGGCTDVQAATVAACAQRQIVCRACESLNAADGTSVDCDALMATLTNQAQTCL
jgi:cysteine-rich repeat protein